VLSGVRQSQVNARIGLTYPELLRGVLRQAPDVVLIGEIGDPVTAAAAVHAANSGTLVLATLHAPTVTAALEALRAWGVHPHFLANALAGVVAQRLIRTLCPKCRVPVPLEQAPPICEEVKPWLGPEAEPVLYDSAGCPACHQTGFAGMTAVFEVLRVTPAVRRLIAEDRTAEEVRARAVEEGLTELRRAALLKVARGETTVGEVLRSMSLESLGVEK
jgi:type II secretory ATPase GspE/PulE/Tfp pilus assembly ATPase PilB-like protein